MGLQTEPPLRVLQAVIDGGGDYVLALKGNQETLHDEVQDYILAQMDNDFADVPAPGERWPARP